MELDSAASTPYEAHRRAVNLIRKFPSLRIVHECADLLNGPNRLSPEQQRHFPPHLLLLLATWAIRCGKLSPYPIRVLTKNDFYRLVNRMHDFDGSVLPNDASHRGFLLFMRRLGFQQFYLQHSADWAGLARQWLFFCDLAAGTDLPARFAQLTGLSISTYCELAVILAAPLIVGEPLVDLRPLIEAARKYPPLTATLFLRSISRSYSETRSHLETVASQCRSVSDELYERSALWRCPLLLTEPGYVCYSPELLHDRLQFFVYTTLKEYDPSWFMTQFGDVFEDYVSRGVYSLGLPVLDEGELRKICGKRSKVVDFAVTEGNVRVLIEAKGVELPEAGRVSLESDDLKRRIKTSVLKGLEQGYAVVRALEDHDRHTSPTLTVEHSYLLIVTYDEMYLSNGETLNELIPLSDSIDPDSISMLPLGNVYIMSIDGFDTLVEAVVTGRCKLVDALAHAVRSDSNPSTAKLVFSQHVEDLCGVGKLPLHLRNAAEDLTSTLKARLGIETDIGQRR